jgi:hypothetical protein
MLIQTRLFPEESSFGSLWNDHALNQLKGDTGVKKMLANRLINTPDLNKNAKV